MIRQRASKLPCGVSGISSSFTQDVMISDMMERNMILTVSFMAILYIVYPSNEEHVGIVMAFNVVDLALS